MLYAGSANGVIQAVCCLDQDYALTNAAEVPPVHFGRRHVDSLTT